MRRPPRVGLKQQTRGPAYAFKEHRQRLRFTIPPRFLGQPAASALSHLNQVVGFYRQSSLTVSLEPNSIQPRDYFAETGTAVIHRRNQAKPLLRTYLHPHQAAAGFGEGEASHRSGTCFTLPFRVQGHAAFRGLESQGAAAHPAEPHRLGAFETRAGAPGAARGSAAPCSSSCGASGCCRRSTPRG